MSAGSMARASSYLRERGFTIHPNLVNMPPKVIFYMLAPSRRGWLSKEQLTGGFLLREGELDSQTLETLWRMADANGDNVVDLSEFEKIWAYLIDYGLKRVEAETAQLRKTLSTELGAGSPASSQGTFSVSRDSLDSSLELSRASFDSGGSASPSSERALDPA
eukprot:SAG25_NODE_2630_length_1481_cov_6.109262_1_plen_162_part_01